MAKISSSRDAIRRLEDVKAAGHNRLGDGILHVPIFRANAQQIRLLSPGETWLTSITADVNFFFECYFDCLTGESIGMETRREKRLEVGPKSMVSSPLTNNHMGRKQPSFSGCYDR
jgi:hypothetical protein